MRRLGETAVLKERSDYHLNEDYFDCVRAVLSYLRRFDLKFHMDVTTEIPLNAGLAGSTAVLVSVLAAILKVLEREHHRHYLAEMLRVIELNYLKIQCGYQDQYMTVFGGINYIDFRGKQFYRDLDDELYATIEPLGDCLDKLPLVVVHTGKKRVSGAILKPIRDRWLDGDRDVVDGETCTHRPGLAGPRHTHERESPHPAEAGGERRRKRPTHHGRPGQRGTGRQACRRGWRRDHHRTDL